MKDKILKDIIILGLALVLLVGLGRLVELLGSPYPGDNRFWAGIVFELLDFSAIIIIWKKT